MAGTFFVEPGKAPVELQPDVRKGENLPSAVREAEWYRNATPQQQQAFAAVAQLGRPVTKIDITNIEKAGQAEISKDAKVAFDQMNSAATFAGDIPRYRAALQAAITGPFAEERLMVSRIFGYNPNQAAATRQVIQGLAKAALNARDLLTGQGAISNFEQEMIAKAEGGEINWSKAELSALLDVSERAARAQYEQGRMFLDTALEAYPETQSLNVWRRAVKPLPAPVARPPNAPRSVVEPAQQTGAVATPVTGGAVQPPAITRPVETFPPAPPGPPMQRLPPAGSAPPPARQRSVDDLLRQYGSPR